MYPLLVTTANNPPAGVPNLKMTDSAGRLIAAKAAVYYWASMGVKDITIADATGSVLLSGEELRGFSQIGCSIEQISYQQDAEAVRKFGKGYGEGRLMEFALQNSERLRASASFYKCTGKVFCRNFRDIDLMIRNNNVQNLFWVGSYTGTIMHFVDLRFFLCSHDLFRSTLLPSYLATSAGGDYVEELVTPGIQSALRAGKTVRPRLSGFSGLLNEPYPETTLGDLEFSFPCFVRRARAILPH